ncbi:NEDD8-activating enzyme E1 regulatory subunit [Lecanosticta acicola]|uniref:NEDD8-activating enzyme E1 regulatory subunit n=1 Tax=Lecanosticta acicola TaxID=111012 RepID=A0AAI8Z0U8_9PEZI|nr:NEDD8-activating enzyme E1 regulatory subunit [Lecanosticta acicola]
MATDLDEVPPPLQSLPTDKEKKYDRQLRLWGAPGQEALEKTHVLLINSGPGVTGVETLKNLVLPGIGRFSILDSATVSEADLGVNFFLEDSSLGKSRAEEAVKYLVELNPEVKGHAITQDVSSWLQTKDNLNPYTLVLIAAPIANSTLLGLRSELERREIPAFYLHSVGYYSSLSLQLPHAFPIVDTHPDPTATTDLRLLKPWPELLDFAKKKTANMSQMNGEEFAHIPWLCLLLRYIEQWKEVHNGNAPQSYQEKVEFRKLVRSGSASEENFDEACAAVLKTLNPPQPSSTVLNILNAPEVKHLSSHSPPFWIIASAARTFYEKHGELPLPGAVPDMKAQSETYIQLQNIYKAKARQDCSEVVAAVHELEKSISYPSSIDEKEVENFCKGAAHIHLIRGKPFSTIREGDRVSSKKLTSEMNNPDSLIALQVAFLAWDHFYDQHQSSPGQNVSNDSGDDAHQLYNYALQKILENQEPSEPFREQLKKFTTELARAGGGELHNIASLTGGMVAQEVIKVITKQYIPIDNTCLFDGIRSKSYVLSMSN